MTYKSFKDFSNIKLKFGSPEQGFNYGYTALPNFACKDSAFFDNEFFILYRRSEYAAQVELACAKIFQQLMGYGLEMEILEENNQFFIASRKIKNFSEGCYGLTEQDFLKVKGLISIFIIWYFIGQIDTHSGNYGLADLDNKCLAFGLDMAEALDFEMLKEPLKLSALKKIPYIVEENYEGVSELILPKNFVASKSFQDEKFAMITLIADTPFTVFESIIRETITSSLSVHRRIMLEKSLVHVEDESTRELIQASLNQSDPEDYSVDALIRYLKSRYEKWKLLVKENLEQDFAQDFSLADATLFLKESEKYHNDDLSDDNSLESEVENLESKTIVGNNYALRFFNPESQENITNAVINIENSIT
ncbi:Uncharacterised protein [Legionella busanensis]|uniref:Uncharacterized protein n=1 Tax=Legionella busanensis TaxID=190655 RepID=A0A378JKV2_9GAMM|nr:hypothetical protein [Legionella busanensis]STX50849.1 Uncharacterised protein [Legionella busanensis]